ncbi:MAG: glycosyltransferase family 39 protein [Candidatus Eremiobacteraeota bacterium]|nr:glycosyltransferase family 39 protein [Candidatus Eremiobacteraeota bacterium]
MNRKKKEFIYPVIIILFIILFGLVNYFWINLDKSPPDHDEAFHLQESVRYYQQINKGEISESFFHYREYYPPLYYQITGVISQFFGRSRRISFLPNLIFLPILVFSMYFIGKKLWDEDVGLLSAIAVVSFPLIAYLSHKYYLDFATTSMVAISFFLLLKSDRFNNPGWTILFFVSIAVGMLVKWSVPFYVALPFAVCFFYFLADLIKDGKNRILNLAFLVLIPVFVLLGYYIIHGGVMGEQPFPLIKLAGIYIRSLIPLLFLLFITLLMPFRVKKVKYFIVGILVFFIIIWHFYALNMPFVFEKLISGASAGVQEGDTYSIPEFIYLFTTGFQGIPFSFLLVIGLIFYFAKNDKTPERNLLVAGLLSGILILYLLPNRDSRYLLPLAIYTAPVCVFWITGIKLKWARYGILTLFIIISFLGFAGWLVYNPGTQRIMKYRGYFPILALGPDREDWKLKYAVDRLVELSRGEKTAVLFMENIKRTNPININSITWEFMRKTGDRLLILHGPWEKYPGAFYRNGEYYSFVFFSNMPKNRGGDFKRAFILMLREKGDDSKIPRIFDTYIKKSGVTGDIKPIEKINLPDDFLFWILEIESIHIQ